MPVEICPLQVSTKPYSGYSTNVDYELITLLDTFVFLLLGFSTYLPTIALVLFHRIKLNIRKL